MSNIIKTITALLAKAEATEFEGERALFYAKAMELLEKHELELSDLQQSEAAKITLSHHIVDLKQPTTTPGQWVSLIGYAAAKFAGVKVYGKEGYQQVFVGESSKVEIAAFMYSNLFHRLLERCDTATRTAVKRKEISDKGGDGKPHRKVWRRAFMIAACGEVARRVDAIVAAKTTAIVLHSATEIDTYTGSVFGRVIQKKNNYRTGEDGAFQKGKQAGQEIDLQSGLGSANVPTKPKMLE